MHDIGRPQLPVAPATLTVGGIPFDLVPFDSIPGSLGAFDAYHSLTPVGTFTITTNVPNPTTVYTLIESAFGSYGADIFKGAGGASASFHLIEGTNVRDYNNSIWNNIIAPGTPSADFPPFRLDRQTFVLPRSFRGDVLTQIVLYSRGSYPQGFVILNAITVEYDEFVPVIAPTVSTSPASDVTKTSATLNGSVTDDGAEACQYRFRYKEQNGDYVYTSWTGFVASGQSFSLPISDLKSNATYYFSAQAKNSAGESDWGNEESFVARPVETPVLKITEARMVSPHELGIDIRVTFPKRAPEESPRKVNLWATVNGLDVFRTFDITHLVQPGETKDISFDYGFDWVPNPVPPRIIDFSLPDSEKPDIEVPRFQDNVEFTLHGIANWEGGLYSEEATPFLVQIPLPVIIIHGYLYTYKQPSGWFLEQLAPVVYADLKKFLHDNGYREDDKALYTTMWGMPEITYRAEELTESALYFKVNGWVTNALRATYADKVNLIGHSTGGLVARYYAGKASTINKVISVGTPHLGLTDFYALAFAEPTRERAEAILRVPGKNLENLIRWFEPQYPNEESCLVDAETGEPMPELYESTFHPTENGNVRRYSIYANNRDDTPYKLWVRQRKNGWYQVVDPPEGVKTTSKGDGYVRAESSSAGGGATLIPERNKNDPNPHPTLCEDPRVQEKILELLRE